MFLKEDLGEKKPWKKRTERGPKEREKKKQILRRDFPLIKTRKLQRGMRELIKGGCRVKRRP